MCRDILQRENCSVSTFGEVERPVGLAENSLILKVGGERDVIQGFIQIRSRLDCGSAILSSSRVRVEMLKSRYCYGLNSIV